VLILQNNPLLIPFFTKFKTQTMRRTIIALGALMATSTTFSMAQKIEYPRTERVSQVDDYFGKKISDPYRWLEDDTAAQTEAWVKAQNALTNSYFAGIPFRDKIKKLAFIFRLIISLYSY
jgi:prolyl oligopeptidase